MKYEICIIEGKSDFDLEKCLFLQFLSSIFLP